MCYVSCFSTTPKAALLRVEREKERERERERERDQDQDQDQDQNQCKEARNLLK